nr:unnamed protein product [Callosobruchus analis]
MSFRSPQKIFVTERTNGGPTIRLERRGSGSSTSRTPPKRTSVARAAYRLRAPPLRNEGRSLFPPTNRTTHLVRRTRRWTNRSQPLGRRTRRRL